MEKQENNDLEEFYEKVGTDSFSKGSDKSDRKDLTIDLEAVVPQSISRGQAKAGKLSQYSLFSTGYMATTATVPTLPSGCYRIKVTDSGFWYDPTRLVTDELIQFPDTRSDEIIAEIDKFWELKRKFKEYGFSHKRGFLIWGPPGSGKTCTIEIVIQKMIKKNGLVILADNPHCLTEGVSKIRAVEPNREMVVIWEDLDAVIERFGEPEVLAVLDGESQIDNVVFVATTNYPEKLDARITNRPSRFDRVVKIDMPNDEARKMFLTKKTGGYFVKGRQGQLIDLVAETRGLSIAHLRELIVGIYCQENEPEDVLARLNSMKQKPSSGHSGQSIGFVSQ